MKKLTLLLLFVVAAITTQAEGLTIIYEDYAAAMAAAKKENKLLLIDFYTTWCGPCKVLSKHVFDNEEHAAAIGENFVLLKYDAEKDTEFHLTKKYHINSYPTGVVLNTEGRVLTKKSGMKPADGGVDVPDYMQYLQEAMEMQRKGMFIKGVSANIKLDYPEFYVRRLNREVGYKFKEEYLNAYWKDLSKDDYYGEVPFAVLSYFGGTDEVMEFFLNNFEKYKELYGNADVENIVMGQVSTKYANALKAKDNTMLQEAKEMTSKYLDKEQADMVNNFYLVMYWQATNNWKEIANHIAANKKELIASGQMNQLCWGVYENCEENEVVKKCASWMHEYNEANPSYASLDTEACLLYKSGNTAEAIKEMERAITMGKASGEDISASEGLLKKMQEEEAYE